MPNVSFGSINILTGASSDATVNVSVTCSGGVPLTSARVCISIDGGSASDATSRLMSSGGNPLRYHFYSDAARSVVWGSWQASYFPPGVTLDVPQNTTRTATVFARVFSNQQTAIPGTYTATFPLNPHIRYGVAGLIQCPTGVSNATTNTSASATVIDSCTITAPSTLDFGTRGLLTANIDAQPGAPLSVQCTNTTPYNIGLNAGTGAGATVAVRKMTGGASTINYSLYTNAARTTIWGNTINTDTVAGTGNGLAQTYNVYGRVSPQTTPAPGTYTDTIIVTVTY